jgi:hypothetical protein
MIKFIKTLDPDNPHVKSNVEFTIPHNDLSLGDIIEEFQNFLHACGYIFEGELDFRDEER